MARKFQRKKPLHSLNEINVTPLLDLVFCLLIIFMISTPLLEQSIVLKLPKEGVRVSTPSDDQAFETISIDREGAIFWGKDRIDMAQLDQFLAEAASRSKTPVISVRGDGGVPYQRVIDVVAAVKRARLTQLHLATEPSSSR